MEYYTKDHEWIEVEGDIGTVGIAKHAAEQLGDIVFVEVPAPGWAVKHGDQVAVAESVKAASDLRGSSRDRQPRAGATRSPIWRQVEPRLLARRRVTRPFV